MVSKMSLRSRDILAFVSLMALTVIFLLLYVDFSLPPYEDAAMLMRYASNIAQGEGIVWNAGEMPVDGATDFLFMITVAFFHFIGFSLETAVRLITISSHFITVALIYFSMRRFQQSSIFPAWLSSAYFAVGPGLFIAASYFGATFFSLAVASAWLLGQHLIFNDKRTIGNYYSFSLVCLVVGLIRPEGVLICIFMLAAISLTIPSNEARRLLISFSAIFIVLGGIYFFWRWSYFGYPLPNPFYKKGGGTLYYYGLLSSIEWTWSMMYPIVIVFLLSLRSKETKRMAIAFSIPILCSVVMWVLLSNTMNFGGRFQYPIFTIGILSWYPLVRTLRSDFRLPTFSSFDPWQKKALVLSTLFIIVVFFKIQITNFSRITYSKDGRYAVAQMLSDYADKGYTIACTEAGILPLYSKWRAVDTWGLNDQWITHNGLITKEYLHKQRPDIIMWNGYFSPLYPPAQEISESSLWDRHVLVLKAYAEQHKFTLAAAFGVSPKNTHYYYINPENSDHDEIVRRIGFMNYLWFEGGKIAENFAIH